MCRPGCHSCRCKGGGAVAPTVPLPPRSDQCAHPANKHPCCAGMHRITRCRVAGASARSDHHTALQAVLLPPRARPPAPCHGACTPSLTCLHYYGHFARASGAPCTPEHLCLPRNHLDGSRWFQTFPEASRRPPTRTRRHVLLYAYHASTTLPLRGRQGQTLSVTRALQPASGVAGARRCPLACAGARNFGCRVTRQLRAPGMDYKRPASAVPPAA